KYEGEENSRLSARGSRRDQRRTFLLQETNHRSPSVHERAHQQPGWARLDVEYGYRPDDRDRSGSRRSRGPAEGTHPPARRFEDGNGSGERSPRQAQFGDSDAANGDRKHDPENS